MSVVVAARRTWIGVTGRGHRRVDETTLAAAVLTAAARDAGLHAVDDVVLGNAAGHGGNVARRAALAAGLTAPGVTVDRQCASGLAAVAVGAALVDAGQAAAVLAGGVESGSRAPARARGVLAYDRASFAPPPWADPGLGVAADRLARDRGTSRARQHAWAVRSHERVRTAPAAGRFATETVAVGALDRDEHARRLDPPLLDRLPGAFVAGGSVTAASAAPVGDGAAAVAVVPDGVPGLRVRAVATCAADPSRPMLGPVAAVRAVCARAGVALDDVAAVELVEAFAVQALAVTDDLGAADDPRWNADGGTLGLGHPFGASGAVAVVRLFARLVTAGAPAGTLGLATAAAAGGLGVALLVEVVR
ncbi:acetyl-CoA C-acyltransferase [Isoptericola sp. S6320L]|uniref:thiolase family protein n=1 Tax=Isoptericola sp. S6320L TaxID=2926411 RepID=UPI001FF3F10B|nr:beta-ketoacyl synthase N-terminal-like domain-containing protein [Isoptericola sp. S6320L]MCK0118477.1 acetyl-CoA C-acyltransferase [Isoptericola sp. S6320L]